MNKKIIYYYQTFSGLDKILYPNNPVTHIHLSAIHFGNNSDESPYIHLNDFPPTNKKFDSVWNDLQKAETFNIKTIIMIGGAGGAFNTLFSNFNAYYSLLKELILQKKVIKGIDLDVEEFIELDDLKKLILQLKKDFGEKFIISMAPVQMSLQEDTPGMGGFIYKDLYNSPEGKLIDYFNGQFYVDYSENAYSQVIKNGYPPEKIVMGMISGEDYEKQLMKICNDYKDFGGVFIWEYYNAPVDWDININKIINGK